MTQIETAHLIEYPGLLLANTVTREAFKTEFQKAFPEIYSDIESMSVNPNCSCVKKVKEFVANNHEKALVVINNFFETQSLNFEDFEKNIQTIATPQTSLSGKILKTSVSKWREFSAELNKFTFRSFAVTKEGEDLYVYFL